MPYTLLHKQLYMKMFIAMCQWSGSRPLASATLLELDTIEVPVRYLVVALCHGDPATLVLQDQLLH